MKNITTSPPAPAQSVATSQGTPAPWTVTENRNLPHRPIEVVGRAGNCCVASGLGDGPEAAANAALIAASPCLLAALESIAAGSAQDTGENGMGTVNIDRETMQLIARAAIAKAKGAQ